jgi:ribonuclease HIII
MSKHNTFTIQLDSKEQSRVKDVLLANNWVEEKDPNQYVKYRLRSPKSSIATMYTSGKLVFQGKEDFTSVIANIKEKNGNSISGIRSHIGVDEVGKGDYFGPLVVVACFVDREFANKINLLGFSDSKKFSDTKIMDFYEKVHDYPYYYSSVVYPHLYNELAQEYGNVSILLAKQHSIVIERALRDLNEKGIECTHIVADQFSAAKSRLEDELGEIGRTVELIQFHKGESDIAVAAASILARGIFLKEWNEMNKKYKFEFPKGSSNVLVKAREFVTLYGPEELRNVAKIGFRTTQEILKII